MLKVLRGTGGASYGVAAVCLALLLAGCSSGGDSGDTGGGAAGDTTISGKVSLSNTVSAPVALKAKPKAIAPPMAANASGKPFGKVMKGSPSAPGNKLGKAVQMAASHAATLVAGSEVSLYDADHPEWLYPVATATTDANGLYTLSTLVNAVGNNNAYNNGDAIPAGNYTVIAIGKDFSTNSITSTTYPYYDTSSGKAYRNTVAVQSSVRSFQGAVSNNDLEVQPSDAQPKVASIMGFKTDSMATTPAGKYDLGNIAVNAAIQVTFDMAMHRKNTPDAIVLKDSAGATVAGTWKMSPDLTVATFYPTAELIELASYTIDISSTATANYYGKGLKANVGAVFTAAAQDTTQPNAVFVSPDVQTGVDIATAIKFASNEAIDVNTITVTSTPSIGAKPTVQSLGYKNVTGQFDYVYQIVPSESLQLNTDYAITVSGGKDLAGNAMTPVVANFKTADTSSGVTGTGDVAVEQVNVKTVIGKLVDSANSGDLALFGSVLSGDFTYAFTNNSAVCDLSSPCQYDSSKNGELSYSEFSSFIQNWFNQNSMIAGWTGDSMGVHLVGNVVGDILVDVATGTAGLQLDLTYLNADGTTYTGAGNNGTVSVYLMLKNVNGTWYVNKQSDKNITGTIGATTSVITTSSPVSGASLAQGTRSITFNWSPVTGATSYAVVLTDNADPTGSTGWVGIIDGQAASAIDYSSVQDADATDGKLSLLGGKMNAPFSKELKLQDGGSYTWVVVGFKTLTAASFVTGTVAPDADIMAFSSGDFFNIGGTLATVGIKVAPQAVTYSDMLYAWDAGAANSVTLDITATSTASTGGWVYVYGNNYAEKSFNFINGKATVTVDLFNGYNWIEVYDGQNWWYATSTQTGSVSPSNYFYTTGGVSYTQLTVSSVLSGGVTVAADQYGYYNLTNATSVTIKGSSSSPTIYAYNTGYDSATGQYNYSSNMVSSSAGTYSLAIDTYSGYNWISLYDDYGNWSYVDIYNAGTGAVYQAPITQVAVNGLAPDFTGGNYWTVNDASGYVNVSGSLANSGTGYWYAYNDIDYTYTSGSLFNNAGTFNASIPAASGNNYIDLYDANGNWLGITVLNQAATQPNTITSIDGVPQTPATSYSYSTAGCSVAINGSAPGSANGSVYVYLYSYDSVTGASISDYQTIYADAVGNYSINQNVYSGTNYVDVSDYNWNWQSVTVTVPAGCAPVSFGVSTVSDGNGIAQATDIYGYYNVGTSSVNVGGTASSGKTITAHVSGANNYVTYTTVAGTANTYSMNLPLDLGYNYISLTDGLNWYYLYVNTTTTAVYTPPISNVSVTGAMLTSGGGVSDTWSNWDTTAGVVDIAGAAQINGTGYYYQYSNYTSASGNLNISNGVFSLAGVALDYGWNYFDLYDANWNYYSVAIYTTGGNFAPVKLVTITSPQQGTTASGSITVSGVVDPAFVPTGVYGYIYDYNTGATTYGYWDGFTDAATITSWGYVPVTYSGGAFSMPATVAAGNPTYIEMYGYDASGVGHGHYLYVNNTYGYTEGFYKPGSKASSSSASISSAKADAHRKEFIKKMKNRNAMSRKAG